MDQNTDNHTQDDDHNDCYKSDHKSREKDNKDVRVATPIGKCLTTSESTFKDTSRLHCHGDDLDEEKSEIVLLGNFVIENHDNATLLQLAGLYCKNENHKECRTYISEVASRLNKEFCLLTKPPSSKTTEVTMEMAQQYKQCSVLLQQCPNSVSDALMYIYKGLVCSGNPVSYDHGDVCGKIWMEFRKEVKNHIQSACQTLEDLMTICQDFSTSHQGIILFMAFEIASYLVKLMSEIPDQSKHQIYTILQKSWLVCAKCHFMRGEYEKALEVLKLVCRDPKQCTNEEVLELSALCLLHTKHYTLAEQKLELCLKVSSSDEQICRLKKLQDHLKQKDKKDEIDSGPANLKSRNKRREADTMYSYGEQINLLESADIDLECIPEVNGLDKDLSDTYSIAESDYSEASIGNTSSSMSTFSKRTKKRKIRRKTKALRQKKGIDLDQKNTHSDEQCEITEHSKDLAALNHKQSTKNEFIEKWRQNSHQAMKNDKIRSWYKREKPRDVLLYVREEVIQDKSDTESIKSHTTIQTEMSRDEFSDSEYDITDSESDWFSSETNSDVDLNENSSEQNPEPSYFERSWHFHKGEFKARNIMEKEYFQKGLDLSAEYVENIGSRYFKRKRVMYNDISRKDYDEQCQKLPLMYKKCTISIESAHKAICTPVELTDNIKQIEISTRSQCGMTYSDDEVVVKIFRNRQNHDADSKDSKFHGEVVSILERHRYRGITHPVFVCLLDLKEGHLMKPLCRTVPKLNILNSKVHRRFKHLIKSRVEIYRYNASNGNLEFSRYHDVDEGEREKWLFIVAYIDWKPNKIYPLAAVIDVVQCSQNPYDGIRILSKEYQVPYFYAKTTVEGVEETFNEAKSFKASGYKDKTKSMKVFTIDPPGCKDLDDGLSITVEEDLTYTVGVHITDVTSIVKKDDPVDKEAQERCQSFYPGKGFRPFAMLPEPLSENVLSLHPNKKRPVISVLFKFNKDGKLISEIPDVQKSVIQSCRQFTYREVQDILDNKDTEDGLFQDVKNLYELSKTLKISRIGDAAFSFPVEIDVSEEENPMETYQAHCLVEEFMILANHSIAKILRRSFPGSIPLRCQQQPSHQVTNTWYNTNRHYIHHVASLQSKEISKGRKILVTKSPPEGRTRKLTPVQSWVMDEIKDLVPKMHDDQSLLRIKQLILSDYLHPKQALAYNEWSTLQESSKYICSTEILGDQGKGNHFSLGHNPYVHFTSPIRRYCDIIIHRLISAKLDGLPCPYQPDEISRLCFKMNDATRRANNFKNECKQFILARYLEKNPILFNGYVKEISDKGVKIFIPGLQNLPIKLKEVRFNVLDVGCKPELSDDVDMLCMTEQEKQRKMVFVKWEKRLYSFRYRTCKKPKPSRFQQEKGIFSPFLRIYPHQNTTFVRYKDQWTKILTSAIEEKWDDLKELLSKFVDHEQTKLNIDHDTETVSSHKRSVKDVSSEVKQGIIVDHRCKFQVPFHHGQVVQVQMSAHLSRGFLTPVPQVFNATDNVKFCMDHHDNPVKTLLRYAKHPSKTKYASTQEYIRIWIPIIEMESAVNAVHGEDSAIINDVPIEFHGRRGRFILTKGFCNIRDLDVHGGDIGKIVDKIIKQELTVDNISAEAEEVNDNTTGYFSAETEQNDTIESTELSNNTTERLFPEIKQKATIEQNKPLKDETNESLGPNILEEDSSTENKPLEVEHERSVESTPAEVDQERSAENTPAEVEQKRSAEKTSAEVEQERSTKNTPAEVERIESSLGKNTAEVKQKESSSETIPAEVEQNEGYREENLSDEMEQKENNASEKDTLEVTEQIMEDQNSTTSQGKASDKKKQKYTNILSSHFLCIKLKHPLPEDVKKKIGNCLQKDSHYIWVAHGELIKTRTIKTKRFSERRGCEKKVLEIDLVFKLHENSPSPPVKKVTTEDKCSIELIMKAKVFRRIECYIKLLGQSSKLAMDIALGRQISPCDQEHLQLCRKMSYETDVPDMPANNEHQHRAIKKALNSRFSLIQGPPGTGKTFTGVKLVYLFNKLNQLYQEMDGKKRQIIFCGPSNKSVDLVARWVINKLGDKAPKIVRMYASAYEYLDFPVPGRALISKRSLRDSKPDSDLKQKGIVLHHIIREPGKPYADQLQELDVKFKEDNEIIRENEKVPHERRLPINTKLEDISTYKQLVYEATLAELKNYDVIFCTTSMAANPKLLAATDNQISQVIIDECGMCSEPESMVPIIATQASQIVLIGDHKQLRPIITCREASELGLAKSLFERYSTDQRLMTMLQVQYRMHASICDFPSNMFYDGKLKTAPGTGTSHKPLGMWPRQKNKYIPRVFCHVEGEEDTLTVKTKEGNEQSKSNRREIEQVIKVFKHMVKVEGVDPEKINIMSQYNAQCTALRSELTQKGYDKFNVTTVVSSQGGEWDYVIFSLVRSLPKYLIEKNPTDGWCIQNLGFITDRHQINVALTRAKKGLVIIGNKNLLECDDVWKKLLQDYQEKKCFFEARNFPSQRNSTESDTDSF